MDTDEGLPSLALALNPSGCLGRNRELWLSGEEVGLQVAETPGSLQAVLGKWFLASRVKAEGVDRCTRTS